MMHRTYPGYYKHVRKLHRLKPHKRVYRYGRRFGVEVFTAKSKWRNSDGPGHICFELTLGEAEFRIGRRNAYTNR